MSLFEVGLATWALTWALSFWYRTEWLREKLGIYLIHDEAGEPVNRFDSSEFSSWVNCPQCCVLLSLPVVMILHRLFGIISKGLAAVGLAVLLVRWYESLRPKARWWE